MVHLHFYIPPRLQQTPSAMQVSSNTITNGTDMAIRIYLYFADDSMNGFIVSPPAFDLERSRLLPRYTLAVVAVRRMAQSDSQLWPRHSLVAELRRRQEPSDRVLIVEDIEDPEAVLGAWEMVVLVS